MLDQMLDFESLRPDGIRPISRSEYDRMVELGMFDDERVELLRGVLVTMSPQNREHAGPTHWLTKHLTLRLGSDWDVRCQLPFAATDDSEPEPDISVSPTVGNPSLEHPSSAVLIIEVSNTSILRDRRVKAPIYAEARVPEYWIVDVSGSELCVEVHTDPTPAGYRHVAVLQADDVLRPIALPGIEIPIRDLPRP